MCSLEMLKARDPVTRSIKVQAVVLSLRKKPWKRFHGVLRSQGKILLLT